MNEVPSVSFSGNPARVEGAKLSQGEVRWPPCWFSPGPPFLCLSFPVWVDGWTEECQLPIPTPCYECEQG